MSVSISDFVKQTLLDIADGVQAAKSEHPKVIAPDNGGYTMLPAQKVEFELNVQVVEAEEASIKAGFSGAMLAVISASVNSERSKQNSETQTQRVSFSIPMHPEYLKEDG